jgi:hypothetical protein
MNADPEPQSIMSTKMHGTSHSLENPPYQALGAAVHSR